MCMFDQVSRGGVCQAVDEFVEDIMRVMKQNVGGGFGRPKVFPSTEHGIVVLGQEAVKFSGKGHDTVFGVVDAGMVVIAHGDGPQDPDTGFLCGNGQTIEEGLIGLFGGPQEELSLGTSTAKEPDAALGDVTGHGHDKGFDQGREVLQKKVTPVRSVPSGPSRSGPSQKKATPVRKRATKFIWFRGSF